MSVGAVLASGIEYRLAEEAGQDPGPAPDGLIVLMNIGAGVLAGGIALLVVAVFLVVLRAGRPAGPDVTDR